MAGNVSIDGIVTVKQDLLERETINTLAEFSAPAELYEALIQRVKKYHPSDDISLIEKVFSIPGIGKLAVDGMMNRDLPLLQGTVVYIALVFVIVNLVVDLSYALIDPRIRYGKGAD